MTELVTYVREKIKIGRKLALWGIGKVVTEAEQFIQELQADNFCFEYCYIDSDKEKQKKQFHGREVMDPQVISKEWYIIISAGRYPEIVNELEQKGFKELEDFIVILEKEFYNALLQNKGKPSVPEIDWAMLDRIEQDIKKNIPYEMISDISISEFELFEKTLGFGKAYNKEFNKRYRRKVLEYYLVDKLLKFDEWSKDEIYIDVGACGSPFAKYLREKKSINAYAIDLDEGVYSYLDYYQVQDATKTRFENDSIKAMSVQSAFEMFVGKSDTNFIREASRILQGGGRLIILPLYMHERQLSTVSPNYYNKGFADEKSFECIRTDCRGQIPLGRFYSLEGLKERVLNVAKEENLNCKVYILPNELVEKDGFVYLKFVLEISK